MPGGVGVGGIGVTVGCGVGLAAGVGEATGETGTGCVHAEKVTATRTAMRLNSFFFTLASSKTISH